jgi:hypothetical protein
MPKEEKRGDLKEFWHFGHVSEDSKYASEYQKCGSQRTTVLM